jgi:hypothetical protein
MAGHEAVRNSPIGKRSLVQVQVAPSTYVLQIPRQKPGTYDLLLALGAVGGVAVGGIGPRITRRAARAARMIRSCAFTDPATAADAAWAASDALHIAADVLGSSALRQPADSYARAARHGYGRIPGPTPAGNRLRATARLLALVATAGGEDQAAVMMLVAQLAELASVVAGLRESQRHAAQALAAPAAAERLHAATCARPGRAWPGRASSTERPDRRARTAAELAQLEYPDGSSTSRPASPGILRQEPAYPPTARGVSQPRQPRGPSP